MYNSTPVFQPSFTFTAGSFFAGVWTSTPFFQDGWEYQGLDLFIGFDITPDFTIGLTDYFDYTENWSYFNYKKEETGHALDLHFMYHGTGGFPLKAMVSTIIAGGDLKWENGRLTDKKNFSTYVELGYGNSFNGFDWEICAGFVPMTSRFYGTEQASFVNFGLGFSKSFEITPTYSLPLSLQFTINPAAESVFLTAAIKIF